MHTGNICSDIQGAWTAFGPYTFNVRANIPLYGPKARLIRTHDWLISGPSKAVLDCQKGVLDREIKTLLQ